jgi:hypothetical protein
MTPHRFRIVTGEEQPDLLDQSRDIIRAAWPEFMMHDPVADGLTECYRKLPGFQFGLVDEDDEWVTMANSIPLRWDDPVEQLPEEGWDWALTTGLNDLAAGRTPNLLCALQIVVPHRHKGLGISREAVRAMTENGRRQGLFQMVAPVRPSIKCDYPLTSIDNYVRWTADGGLPFDPWMRVHARLGARIVKPCHRAMRISGTIAEWESWTGLSFPESGQYIVPGALVPVEFDIAAERGTYVEPNVWMHHPAALPDRD